MPETMDSFTQGLSYKLTTIRRKIRLIHEGNIQLNGKQIEELYVEVKQSREIERERVKNGDFSGAASLPATNELQPKDRKPGKENK
jgi:hypothetical protein